MIGNIKGIIYKVASHKPGVTAVAGAAAKPLVLNVSVYVKINPISISKAHLCTFHSKDVPHRDR